MEGERKSKGERGQGTGRWHTRGGRVVGGDRRIPSYSGDYRYAREDKGVEVQLLLFESFGGFGKGVREILRKAADVLQIGINQVFLSHPVCFPFLFSLQHPLFSLSFPGKTPWKSSNFGL